MYRQRATSKLVAVAMQALRPRLVFPALAAGLAALFTASAPTAAMALATPASQGGQISSSPAGYVGCVTTANQLATYCFAADVIAAGASAGSVEVAVSSRGSVTPSILPAGALVAEGHDVRLAATVPGIGAVDLLAQSQSAPGLAGSDAGCPGYGVMYGLQSQTAVDYEATIVTGTVNGGSVSASNRCGAYFTGATSGLWAMT